MRIAVLCDFESGSPAIACIDAPLKLYSAAWKAAAENLRLSGERGHVTRPIIDGDTISVPWRIDNDVQPVPWITYTVSRFEVDL